MRYTLITGLLTVAYAGLVLLATPHRRPPDLTPQVRAWFAGSGFEEIAFDALETSALTSVGVHRLRHTGPARPPSHRLFTFVTT